MFLPVLRLSTFFCWPSRDLPGQRLPLAGLWRRLGRSDHRFVQTFPTFSNYILSYININQQSNTISMLRRLVFCGKPGKMFACVLYELSLSLQSAFTPLQSNGSLFLT
jgi:hypothetical protein